MEHIPFIRYSKEKWFDDEYHETYKCLVSFYIVKGNGNDKKIFSLSKFRLFKETERDGNLIISPNTRKSICMF